MKRVIALFAFSLLHSAPAVAQPRQHEQPPRSDLSAHNDEFAGTALDTKWKRFDTQYGWPDKLKRIDLDYFSDE